MLLTISEIPLFPFRLGHQASLIELGNLEADASPANTYIALTDLARYFVEQSATCIVLGGTQELTWPLYQGIVEKSRPVNVTIIDQTIDLDHCSGDFSSNCFVEKFIQQPADQLYNLCLLGFQGYLTSSVSINIAKGALSLSGWAPCVAQWKRLSQPSGIQPL